MSAKTSPPAALSLSTRTPEDAALGAETGVRSVRTTCGCVDSTVILRGQKTVEITHNGSTYRLQATRLGKLILTK